MKKTLLLITSLALLSFTTWSSANHSKIYSVDTEFTLKGPEMLEVLTNYKTIKEALLATKMALMKEQFIATNGMQETSFTAKRTTGSEADYFIADVMADKEEDGTIKLIITFMKIGSGMLNLSKISQRVKQNLNIKSDISSSDSSSSNQKSSSFGKQSYFSIGAGFFPFYKREQDDKRTPIYSLRFEAGLGSRIGLLFHFGYGHHEGSYFYESSSAWGTYTELIEWDNNYINFGSSLVFYPIKKDKIDVYALGGIGLAYRLERIGLGFDTKLNLKAGLRYHLTDKVGVYTEAGLGLSKFNLGLSISL